MSEVKTLESQQSNLQADYSEMEALRQQREAQVVQRVLLRFANRCVGTCFTEWKEFITEMVRERDRNKYASQVDDLQTTNTRLHEEHTKVSQELAGSEKQNSELKAKQLILSILNRELSRCFMNWRGFARDHVEERHERQVDLLRAKIEEMRTERDALRTQLDGAELEGLKIAMTKFELEEQDLQKENQINELTAALTQARDAIGQQVELWPSSSKVMRRELQRLDQAHNRATTVRQNVFLL
jgi:hypothetical protein